MMSLAPRADRHAHADLARPLGDRDQHDVHHADAADDQRDHRDRARSAGSASGWSLSMVSRMVSVFCR